MITVLPIDASIQYVVDRHNLRKKFEKQIALLVQNPKHPSLHLERLEPRWRGLCSFRIDRKYRAILAYKAEGSMIEILSVTLHYQ